MLHKTLDVVLCDGVSSRWLAAQIRGTHLLDRHGWTQEDLRDLLHGAPEHLHLPRHVRDPRRWIRARLAAADPHLPPTKLRKILAIERRSAFFQQRHAALEEERVATERADRRAAIDQCHRCDELGLARDPRGPGRALLAP